MATAYFINATPTDVTIQLNAGDLHKMTPMTVDPAGTSVSSPAWGATVGTFRAPDQFAGDNNDNELLFSSPQHGKTRRYSIKSTVSTVLNLFFFMFEDSIVGEDQTGSSAGIEITLLETRDGSL